MKTRQDFVSNSSSTSFIMLENEKDSFHSHLGHSYKLFKLNTIRNEFINLQAKIASAKLEFKNQTGLDEDTFRSLFEATYFGLHNCSESIDEDIKEVDIALYNYENKDCFISEPIDRDRAYQLRYYQSTFKGDL